uniref:Peptidyl-tRNA hydrolase 1 homolog n=1 Tax=Ovis aries TaxID=9940 RepID=A0AC11D3X0_SHEEP
MGLPGLSHAGLWLSRAMSRCVLEPRPAGKRWLVAGLGNPGLPGTRHSVGMAVLGHLARRLGVAESWARDRRCAADLALASLGDAQLVLLQPRRLMNLNGHSVARAAELFGLTAEEVYLVHDELDKPLGKVALKLGGSARGHNGVRSCMSCLNSSVSLPLHPALSWVGWHRAPPTPSYQSSLGPSGSPTGNATTAGGHREADPPGRSAGLRARPLLPG